MGLIITGLKLPKRFASNAVEKGFQILVTVLSFIKENGVPGIAEVNPPNDVNVGDETVNELLVPLPSLLSFPKMDDIRSFADNGVGDVFSCCV